MYIGESSSFYQTGYTDKAFQLSNIKQIADKYGAEIIAFEKTPVALCKVENGVILDEVLLSEKLKEVDYIINLPKLKTHYLFMLSCAVKNLYGCIPGGTKQEYHFVAGEDRQRFGEMLCDIYSTIKPNLTIIDAVWGLEGSGPDARGKPKKTNLILMSENPFAIDFIASKIMGYDPYKVFSIKAGINRGFLSNPVDINLTGDFDIIPQRDFKKPIINGKKEFTPRSRSLFNILLLKPKINTKKCDVCGSCIERCPFDAISMNSSNDKIEIDIKKCFSCYQCYFKCPNSAITLKGSLLNKLIRTVSKIYKFDIKLNEK